MQANASDEEDQAPDQATAGEEGAESPVAGRRGELLAAHRLDLQPPRHVDPGPPADVQEHRGVAHIAPAAHHARHTSAERTDGDDVVESAGGAATVLPDEAALAPAAVHPATRHVRNVLDTAAALASRVARQDGKSVDSDRARARRED